MAPITSKEEESDITKLLHLPEDADYAVLQQSLNTGVRNVKQILRCIRNGSKEIKDIILNECNVIYECRVCQNLFRSLANLLFHKRGFCKKHLCENMLLFEYFDEGEIETVLPVDVGDTTSDNNIAPNAALEKLETPDISEKKVEVQAIDDDVIIIEDDGQKEAKKHESDEGDRKIIESEKPIENPVKKPQVAPVAPRKSSSRKSQMPEKIIDVTKKPKLLDNKPRDRVSSVRKVSKVTEEKKEEAKPKEIIPIILKPIVGNTGAMFQVVKKNSADTCTIKIADDKITSGASIICNSPDDKKKLIIVVPSKTNLSPVTSPSSENLNMSKPKDIHLSRRKRLLNRSDCCVQNLKCLKCSTQFTTLKTLYFHMMSVHSQKRMYFPCPYCKALFVQMYGVTRHLIQIHGKTKEQINNKMRDAIRKTAIWRRIDNVGTREDNTKASEKENSVKGSDDIEGGKITQIKFLDSSQADSKLLHSYVKVENNISLHHCTKCRRVFSRKSSQVSHEKFCIMSSPPKVEHSEIPLSQPSRPSSVTVTDQSKKMPIEIRLSARPKRGAEKQMHKDFVDSQTLKWRSANRIETAKPNPQPSPKKTSKSHEKKILSMVNQEKLLCLKCNRKFSSFSNLRRHAAIHIGWTRYKCKCCDYQSYNKSDCIHHIARMHTSVSEQNIEKYVVHLVSDTAPSKSAAAASPKTSPKSIKALSPEQGKASVKRKKKGYVKKAAATTTNRRKVQPPVKVQQKRKNSSDSKPASPLKKSPVEPQPEKVQTPKTPAKKIQLDLKKLPNSYRSVTTNSPTTIILSKTCSSSTVQITKNSTPVPIYNSLCGNVDKITPTRISPRKIEPNIKLIPSLSIVNRDGISAISRKTNVVKIRIPCQIANDMGSAKKPDSSPEKSPIKKSRPISDWFVKKEIQSTSTDSMARRENAPVIIDLVRAANVSPPKMTTSTK